MPDNITVCDQSSYNGTLLTPGAYQDKVENPLTIFSDVASTRYMNGALYSFILFNRTLTEEEINWVKANLIEGDTEL